MHSTHRPTHQDLTKNIAAWRSLNHPPQPPPSPRKIGRRYPISRLKRVASLKFPTQVRPNPWRTGICHLIAIPPLFATRMVVVSMQQRLHLPIPFDDSPVLAALAASSPSSSTHGSVTLSGMETSTQEVLSAIDQVVCSSQVAFTFWSSSPKHHLPIHV